MKALRVLLALLALVTVPAAWLLGTAGGLQAVAALASRLSDGRLSIDAVDGRLAGEVRVRGLAWRSEGVTVAIDRAELNLRLSRLLLGRVQAERLAIGELRVAAQSAAADETDAASAPLSVRMPLWLAVEAGAVERFTLQLAGRAAWRLRDAQFGARWRDQWLVIGRLSAHSDKAGDIAARGRLAILEDQVRFRDFVLEGPGVLRAEGALAFGAAENALDLAWENLQPGLLPIALTSAQGRARLEGPWRAYRWQLQGDVVVESLPAGVEAQGRGDLRSLTIERLRLAALAGTLRGSGRLDWSEALRTELSLDWTGLDPAAIWPAWPGTLNGQGRLVAHWRERPAIDFDVDLTDSSLRGYAFALHAVGRTEAGRVQLETATLRSGASTLQGQGELLPQLALTATLDSPDLGAVWAGLGGRAQLQLRASGTLSAPRIRSAGTVDALAYRTLRARRAVLEADLALQGRSEFSVELAGVEGVLPLQSLRLRGAGTRQSHRLQLELAGVEAGARFALEGGAPGAAWRGRITQASITPPAEDAPARRWRLEEAAALSYAGGRLRLAPICLQTDGSRACVEVDASAARQYLALRTQALAWRHLQPLLAPDWTLSGAVSGTAQVRFADGEMIELRADLNSTAGALEGPGVRLPYGPAELLVEPDEQKLHARFRLRPAGGEVAGELWVSPGTGLLDRPMLGDLHLRLPDLSWLPVLSPEIASAQGAIDADLHVSGSPRSPSLDGQLQVRDGRVRLATPGIELVDITASFERGRDAPLRLRAQARSGEGQFAIDGEFRSLQPQVEGELTVRGENVLGLNRPDIRAWLSPDLRLSLDGRRARLTGVLGVPRADITPRDLERGGVAPSGDQVLVVADDGPARRGALVIESEVKIALGDAVRIDGLGLTTRLTGAITAYDDPSRPTRARGELRLEGGRYRAYGQDLQIESGSLIFSGGPVTRPAIDITAVRKPTDDIKVGLHARGTLDAPEFSLFSEPAMSQEEQLSWLVLGRSLSATLDGNQRTELSSAAVSLGLTGGDYLAQQLAPRLGLDEVSIGAKPGETADLARFTIGKYLSPRIFVSYGIGLFQPGHFFRLQYDISRRFKLVGETGLQQSGDLLYTIER